LAGDLLSLSKLRRNVSYQKVERSNTRPFDTVSEGNKQIARVPFFGSFLGTRVMFIVQIKHPAIQGTSQVCCNTFP